VCRGDGHTEAIRIEFDPEKISYETLIADVLRKGTGGRSHTHVERLAAVADAIGACKAQYMSAVWAQDEKQKEVASKLAAQMKSTMPVLPAASWHDAEDYHQKYVQKSRR